MTIPAHLNTSGLAMQKASGPSTGGLSFGTRLRALLVALPVVISLGIGAPPPAVANPLAGGILGGIAGTVLGGIFGGGSGARAGALFGGLAGTIAGAAAEAERRRQDNLGAVTLPIGPSRPVALPSGLVVSIQQSLVLLGYNPGPVDGILGFSTREAIKAYQRNNGLPVTGLPSQALARHMLSNGPNGTTTISGGRPGMVYVVGVAFDDVLNVRSAPSSNARVVGSLSPFAKGIRRYECLVPAGSSTEWCKIRKGSVTGWVSARFIAPQIMAPQPPLVAIPQ